MSGGALEWLSAIGATLGVTLFAISCLMAAISRDTRNRWSVFYFY